MPDASPAPFTSHLVQPGCHLLFVYGTLKRGGSNGRWMDGQRFLGPARTAPGVTLYSLGEYPGLVAEPSDRDGVVGELWVVDAAALARLDEFEGVGEGLYAREPARLVEYPADLAPAEAARAELYRYLRKAPDSARLGSFWPVADGARDAKTPAAG
jgi:gamma-glutamylaminecyclotransferase